MRYIADSSGYVKEVSFGADIVCGGQECTEYTGAVPSGYASLEAWYISEVEKLYRWKIVSGNLTLDSAATAPGDNRPMRDYITNNVDGNIWHVEQYANGRYRAWCKVANLKPSSMTATGSNYYATIPVVDIPSFSTSVESIKASLDVSQVSWISRVYVSSGTVQMTFLRSISASPTLTAYVELQGRYD